jgi:hypothetical protein
VVRVRQFDKPLSTLSYMSDANESNSFLHNLLWDKKKDSNVDYALYLLTDVIKVKKVK